VSEDYLYPGMIIKLTDQPPPDSPLGSENLKDEEAAEAHSPLNTRGDVSNIDMIYKHVIEEGKRVKESFKGVGKSKVKELGKGLLGFWSNKKVDTEEAKLISRHFDLNDPNKVKVEAYYCTKLGRVKGLMSVKDKIIMYDPIRCEENCEFGDSDINSKFQACIDIKDVEEVQIMKQKSATAEFVCEEEARASSYLYDYYIIL
jgi:hypothetical protein